MEKKLEEPIKGLEDRRGAEKQEMEICLHDKREE